jgi:hypothetical protein
LRAETIFDVHNTLQKKEKRGESCRVVLGGCGLSWFLKTENQSTQLSSQGTRGISQRVSV